MENGKTKIGVLRIFNKQDWFQYEGATGWGDSGTWCGTGAPFVATLAVGEREMELLVDSMGAQLVWWNEIKEIETVWAIDKPEFENRETAFAVASALCCFTSVVEFEKFGFVEI